MVSHSQDVRSNRLAWALAGVCCVVFALGMFIGYHSIYRNISVAMLLPPPHAASPL